MTTVIRLAVYLLVARWLPPSTSPAGRLWRWVRRVVAAPVLASAGRDVNIEYGAYFGRGDQVHLGDRSGIGVNCRLHGPVRIGANVMMGPEVLIYARGHGIRSEDVSMIDQGFEEAREVVIGDDVWLGARAIILPGVHVGRGSVVGAGAVVSKDVPPHSVAVGNPARVVRSRVP
jgi:maltose O-acetyltransferase